MGDSWGPRAGVHNNWTSDVRIGNYMGKVASDQ